MLVLTPLEIQTKRFERLKELHTATKESAIRANEVSTTYRSNMAAIHDKLIIISLGSASLLLTFVGVLFGSTRNTSALTFKWVVFAIIAYVFTTCLLFISRWALSDYLFTTVHRYYLQDRLKKEELQLLIYEAGTGVDGDTFEEIPPGKLKEFTDVQKNTIKAIKTEIKNDKGRERSRDFIGKWSERVSYVCLALGYVFTLTFFLGVLELLNKDLS